MYTAIAGLRKVIGCQPIFGLAAACLMLSLGGCSDYFARRDMESTLAAWIGSSPTTKLEFVNPIAYAVVKKDAIDAESPLAKAIGDSIARLDKAGISYSMQVAGELFDLKTANDDRLIFCRQGDSLSVRISQPSEESPDSVQILVSRFEFSD
jgi:hypothetical protein